ncbi:MAG: hypothetical protein AAF501_08105 [Pseudomonadota bacterium]
MAATGFKDKMKAVLNIEPTAEMKPIDKKFIEGNSDLKKHYKTLKYEEEIKVDTRKWNPAKLKDGLSGLIRYDLKILAVEVARLRQGHDKSTANEKKSADKASTRSMMQIVKSMREVEAKLNKSRKRLDDITPDRKGIRKVSPKNPREAKAFDKEEKDLKADIKKMEAEEKKIIAERDKLEDGDRQAQRDELKSQRSGALPAALIAEIKSCYDELEKELANKCSLALEELASGGDDKKAARAGKDAMKRLKDSKKIESLFSVHRSEMISTFKSLEFALKNAPEDSPKADTAYNAANSSIKKTRSSFDKKGGEVKNAIEYLLKTGDKKDLKDSAVMGTFTQTIKNSKTKLKSFADKIEKFDSKIVDWHNEVSSKGLSIAQVGSNKKEAEGFSGYDSDAKSIVSILKDLNSQFEKVESELK